MCQFKLRAKCSSKHVTNRCTMRSAHPQPVGRADAVRPANTNRQEGCLQYLTAETAILLEGFSTGFPIHYGGPQGMRLSSNHQSALQAATIVEQKLCHEISLGRVAGPFQEIPFPNFQSSPLGLFPKHDLGKFLLIHDLSFPKGDSSNFIP